MKISTYNSRKITVINLLLILLVILIHSYYLEAEQYRIAVAFQKFTGTAGLSRVAVPMFFAISGLLFFKGTDKLKDCFPKIKKRMRTLLIPYIIWNCIYILWYVVLQNIPGIGSFINSDLVGTVIGGSVMQGIKEALWSPAGFHLWFLRDLILMVLCSPIIYIMCKHLRWFAPLLFAVSTIWGDFSGTACFALGGCVALHSNLERIEELISKKVLVVCALLYIGNAVWQVGNYDIHPYYKIIIDLCGIICVWKLYDYLSCCKVVSLKLPFFNYALGYSFFIYLFHEPTFNIIKKLSLKIIGIHEWSLMVLYITNPLVMCLIAIMIAKLLQKTMPKVYSILVGGR